MHDRPSLGAAFLRVLLGAGAVALGVWHLREHERFVADLTAWDIPSPENVAWALGGAEVFLGVILLIGLAPRLAALLLLIEMGVAMATAGRAEGLVYLVVPGVAAFFLFVLVGAGGGRFCLIDRIDPPKPRRLARE